MERIRIKDTEISRGQTPGPIGLQASLQAGELGRAYRDAEAATLDEVRVDVLRAAERPDLVHRLLELALQVEHPGLTARAAGVALAGAGQGRGDPAAVAAGRAEPGERGLQHDHAQVRVGLLQVPGRPQAGETGADDADVRLGRPGQRVPAGREAAAGVPPVGHLAVTHGRRSRSAGYRSPRPRVAAR